MERLTYIKIDGTGTGGTGVDKNIDNLKEEINDKINNGLKI
nr:hypothetical protein [Candidatus Gracilibacteria bacterium]